MKPINPAKITPLQRRHLKDLLVPAWSVVRNRPPLKLPTDLARAKKKIDKLEKRHTAKHDAIYAKVRNAYTAARTAVLFAPPAEALAAVNDYLALVEHYKK